MERTAVAPAMLIWPADRYVRKVFSTLQGLTGPFVNTTHKKEMAIYHALKLDLFDQSSYWKCIYT